MIRINNLKKYWIVPLEWSSFKDPSKMNHPAADVIFDKNLTRKEKIAKLLEIYKAMQEQGGLAPTAYPSVKNVIDRLSWSSSFNQIANELSRLIHQEKDMQLQKYGSIGSLIGDVASATGKGAISLAKKKVSLGTIGAGAYLVHRHNVKKAQEQPYALKYDVGWNTGFGTDPVPGRIRRTINRIKKVGPPLKKAGKKAAWGVGGAAIGAAAAELVQHLLKKVPYTPTVKKDVEFSDYCTLPTFSGQPLTYALRHDPIDAINTVVCYAITNYSIPDLARVKQVLQNAASRTYKGAAKSTLAFLLGMVTQELLGRGVSNVAPIHNTTTTTIKPETPIPSSYGLLERARKLQSSKVGLGVDLAGGLMGGKANEILNERKKLRAAGAEQYLSPSSLLKPIGEAVEGISKWGRSKMGGKAGKIWKGLDVVGTGMNIASIPMSAKIIKEGVTSKPVTPQGPRSPKVTESPYQGQGYSALTRAKKVYPYVRDAMVLSGSGLAGAAYIKEKEAQQRQQILDRELEEVESKYGMADFFAPAIKDTKAALVAKVSKDKVLARLARKTGSIEDAGRILGGREANPIIVTGKKTPKGGLKLKLHDMSVRNRMHAEAINELEAENARLHSALMNKPQGVRPVVINKEEVPPSWKGVSSPWPRKLPMSKGRATALAAGIGGTGIAVGRAEHKEEVRKKLGYSLRNAVAGWELGKARGQLEASNKIGSPGALGMWWKNLIYTPAWSLGRQHELKKSGILGGTANNEAWNDVTKKAASLIAAQTGLPEDTLHKVANEVVGGL